MVYIGRDGRVLDKQPWGIDWFIGCIIGFYRVVVAFFTTLISPLTELAGSNNDGGNRRRGGGSSGGSSGWDGGGPGSGRGPGAPQRRIGRITTMSDCTIPGGG